MSKNSKLDDTPTSTLIAARIIELTEIKRVIEKRLDELNKAGVGIENLATISGQTQIVNYPKLLELPWKPSKYPEDNPIGEWIHFKDVPDWVRQLSLPIEDAGFKYWITKPGNLKKDPL